MRNGLVAAGVAAMFLAACGKDSSGPSAVPTSVSVADGTAMTATVGTVVTPAPTFTVKDQSGNPLAGVPITITVTAGGGTLTGSPTTTSAGPTSIGVWTLGTIVGVNTITIKAGDLAPITFSITTVAGPPTQILVSSGANQSAAAGTALAPISVRVADQFGNGVVGLPVTITVTAGGGQVTPASGTTGANGELTEIAWTLGKSALPQLLSVKSGAITGSVSATIATQYTVDVRYVGGEPNPDIRLAFDNAAARIRGAITGAVGPVPFVNKDLNPQCDVPVVLNETVRDLLIFAQVKPIDGVGKILGRAGPCFIRNTSRLTIVGIMEFDSEDLDALAQTGRLEAVILHEMSHVVGFGTLWEYVTPSLLSGPGTAEPRFLGIGAINACTAAGGTTLCAGGVAVENCVGILGCGAGTRDGHWREGTSSLAGFRTELMTGYIERQDVPMPYSNISIQSFGDLGYLVNANAADPYRVPSPTLRAMSQLGGSTEVTQWESLRYPTATVTRTGTITPIDRQ